jgi:hypothetical protein
MLTLSDHRNRRILIGTYTTQTIVVVVIAKSAFAAVRNPRFDTIFENI